MVRKLLFLVLILVLVVQCSRDDSLIEKQLDKDISTISNQSNLSPQFEVGELSEFVSDLKNYFFEDVKDVGKALKKKHGDPIWIESGDHSQYHHEGQLAFIPFIDKKGTEVSTVMVAFKGKDSDLTFHLLERKDLKSLRKKKDLIKNDSGRFEELTYELMASSFCSLTTRFLTT